MQAWFTSLVKRDTSSYTTLALEITAIDSEGFSIKGDARGDVNQTSMQTYSLCWLAYLPDYRKDVYATKLQFSRASDHIDGVNPPQYVTWPDNVKFDRRPAVACFVAGLDFQAGKNINFDVSAGCVTETGALIAGSSWGDSKMYFLDVVVVAIGQVPFE